MSVGSFFETHGETYLKKCNELEIEPNPAALPQVDEPLEAVSSQQSLDGFVKTVPKWSKEGLLEHIIDFVVSDDQVCAIHL